jgi:SOS response regulatory protein OraA/RecX
MKIKQELARRGIAPELATEAIESVFGPDGLSMRRYMEEELAEEQLGPWTPASVPESALLVAARRQYQLTAGLREEARKRRIVGWLQRRGHSWEVVSRVLQWLSQVEKEEAMERDGEQ